MGTLRTHTTRRPPMPDENEIGVKFNQVLLLMDLQPEKVKQLQQLPLTKKWEMICDQVCFKKKFHGTSNFSMFDTFKNSKKNLPAE